jgi:hypothetical protein|tara:strand:+ start:2348 stop:2626 length:279 start_codon:yes stop_codon:yes gene_type:complete
MSIDLDKCVYLCMRDGRWWTFWELQEEIQQKTGHFYGEPSISAAIRNLRKWKQRVRFDLPTDDTFDPIERKRITDGKGNRYRLKIDTNEAKT